jgi:hypothetical protein
VNPAHTHTTAEWGTTRLAKTVRRRAILHIDHFLVELETNFQRGKGKLYWCTDADDVFQCLARILDGAGKWKVHVAADPLPLELKLKQRLGARPGAQVVDNTHEEEIAWITGTDFVTCDVPTACILSPDGARLPWQRDGLVVMLASIDQLLPSFTDLYAILPIVRGYGRLTAMPLNAMPHLHLILVDNGRSALLGKSPQNQLLEMGQPRWMGVTGRHGAVLEKLYYLHLKDADVFGAIDGFLLDGFAAKASALPLAVDQVIVSSREAKAAKENTESDLLWRGWKNAMMNRKMLNRLSLGILSPIRMFYKRGFGHSRSFPKVEKVSFNEQWVKERPTVVESRKLTDIPKGQLLVRKPNTDGVE